MNVVTQRFFASLAEQLNRGATRAALGLLSFRSDPLREHLRGIFQSAPGTGVILPRGSRFRGYLRLASG